MTATYRAHPAAELFPMLPEDELRELADDIKVNGLIDPVWLVDSDGEMLVLDGRNRLAACALAGVEPTTRVYEGDDPVTFSISQNVKRRHLTTGQKAAVAYAALPLFEEQARVRQVELAGTRREKSEDTADRQEGAESSRYARQSSSVAASTTGTSGRSLARFKRVAEEAPDLAEKVREGFALDRAERIIRDREAEQRRIEQARRDAELAGVQTRVDIRRGDFREVLSDLSDVDAIITDPPYPREFIPLLGDLATWADQVLSPEGVLVVLIGQTYLPEVYRLLEGGRPYRWTGCYYTPGPGYVSWNRKVQSNWKPFLVYGGGPRFGDVVTSEGSDADAKNNHKWGQDYNAFHTLVERFTTRGQTVVDPFMGAGTTLLAARALGRHAVGCDVDEEHVARSRERLS